MPIDKNRKKHYLHEVVSALERSLKKAEKGLEEEGGTKFTISNFEIDFPAKFTTAPLGDDSGQNKDESEYHAVIEFPETSEIKQREGAASLNQSIRDSHLSRIKLVLNKHHVITPSKPKK